MKLTSLVFALAVLIPSPVFADVGCVGGSGHTIVLLNAKPVQLVAEEVTIVPFPAVKAEADLVAYRCRFVLRNLLETDTTIKVGFPLDADQGDGADGGETDRVFSYSFIARDEHDTFHVRYIPQATSAKYRGLFVWDMNLSAKEEKVLRVGYMLRMSVAVADAAKQEQGPSANRATNYYARPWYAVLESCNLEQVTYVPDAGNSWNGPIENAVFRIGTLGMDFWMGWRRDFFLVSADPPSSDALLQRLHRMKVGLTYLQLTPGDWEYNAEDSYMTCTQRNYVLATPIRCSWFGTSLPREPGQCESVVRQLMGEDPPRAEVLELARSWVRSMAFLRRTIR